MARYGYKFLRPVILGKRIDPGKAYDGAGVMEYLGPKPRIYSTLMSALEAADGPLLWKVALNAKPREDVTSYASYWISHSLWLYNAEAELKHFADECSRGVQFLWEQDADTLAEEAAESSIAPIRSAARSYIASASAYEEAHVSARYASLHALDANARVAARSLMTSYEGEGWGPEHYTRRQRVYASTLKDQEWRLSSSFSGVGRKKREPMIEAPGAEWE